jgi:hypothetical protein
MHVHSAAERGKEKEQLDSSQDLIETKTGKEKNEQSYSFLPLQHVGFIDDIDS